MHSGSSLFQKEFNPIEAHRYWCPYYLTDNSTARGQNTTTDLKSMDESKDIGLKYILNFLIPKSDSDPINQDLHSVR